jgi:CHAD domain-containing protein
MRRLERSRSTLSSVADHGKSYRLAREESAADGVRRVAAARAEKAAKRLREASDEERAAAIHGARKDLKKIRAALRLVRDELGKKTYRAESRRYREAGRLLSASRDASVKLETLAGLRKRSGDALPASLARACAAALEADRARIEGAAAGSEAERIESAAAGNGTKRIGEALAAIEAAAEVVPAWDLGGGSWSLIAPGLTRSYREGREALARTRRHGSAANVHELRKRVKDLWYQLRLLHDAWPEQLQASAAEAHRLAELLGDHHDLAVLAADLGSRQELDANRSQAEQLIAARQDELLREALALGARLYAEKPKHFRRRIRAYWRAWKADEEEGTR